MSLTVDNISTADKTTTGPRSMNVPTNLRQDGVMSDTSLAVECFVNQRFSANLQAYLISYVGSVYSQYSVYAV